MDTFPKVMELCFPGIEYNINMSDLYATFANGSEIWFGGLDDKDRVDKILGNEYCTIALCECSQIAYAARNVAMTRLAQKVYQEVDGVKQQLPLKIYYDENPPDKGHWSYKMFIQKLDPETRAVLKDPEDFATIQMNPTDNTDNLPPNYIDGVLSGLSARERRRFLDGEFRDENPDALFNDITISKNRQINIELPQMLRLVIAVDPSGASDAEEADNDAIGIVVAGLGTDGNGYLLEDLTLKAGPETWGKVATDAYHRHAADIIVGEVNYGGEMVSFVIKAADSKVPFKKITSSRGKAVRAEPLSALVEQGKIRHVGYFPELEEELCSFTTRGYTGSRSPNRADAYVFAFAELFPGIVNKAPVKQRLRPRSFAGANSWMG
jgi:hypothetical protein